MTVLLLCQMAYMLIGETAHEWIGTVMFALFILHHILNVKWYRNLIRGRYTVLRTVQTLVNFLLLFSMIGLMVSGIMMSREVFAFLSIDGGMGFARILHMLAAYWGFVLMSVHLGFHWGMVIGMVRKVSKRNQTSKSRTWFLRALALLLCGTGIYAFLKNDLASYMLLKNQFVFFDMEQPLLLFFAEYIAMMGLWACIAYYAGRAFQRLSARKAIKMVGDHE